MTRVDGPLFEKQTGVSGKVATIVARRYIFVSLPGWLFLSAAATLVALAGALHALGGREATLVLTGAIGPSVPLGLAYVASWLAAVAFAPALVLGAAFDAIFARLRPRGGGPRRGAAWGSISARSERSRPRGG